MSSSAVMKGSYGRLLLLPLALLLVLTPTPAPAAAAPFKIFDIVKVLVPKVADAVAETKEVEMLGHVCTLYRRGIIRSFELYYSATFTCPGWTTITGRDDTHQNPSNSETAAVRDFVKQAVSKGLMTQEQAVPWL